MSPKWSCVAQHDDLRRSSLTVAAIRDKVYVFGGELEPRQPRDNKTFVVDIAEAKATVADDTTEKDGPSPRVGSATASLNGRIYMFSGRGGTAMTPIDEAGGLWEYFPDSAAWKLLTPADASAPVPAARSYHTMISDEEGTIFIHAGCPASGRLSDLWAFEVSSRAWTELPGAPNPPRGGASITYLDHKLYRMNGFDGKTEQGGKIDVFDIASQTWTSKSFTPDNKSGPEARSVAALLPIVSGGRHLLVTMLGERDPSSLGHAGAGKMLDDTWIYDIEAEIWTRLDFEGPTPQARGWFDADIIDKTRLVVVGGLSEDNQRLNDAWLLEF